MTTSKPNTTSSADASKAAAEVSDRVAKELEQGYVGYVPDETPNSAYALTSGPDAPPVIADNRTRAEQYPARVGEGA